MSTNFNEENKDRAKERKKHSFSDIRKRMSDAYQRNQREKKIDKLMNDTKHWKGLS